LRGKTKIKNSASKLCGNVYQTNTQQNQTKLK